MQTDIFRLQIIPLKDILVHEQYDESRAYPLVERLKKDKFIANPIIVAQIEKDKFLQLDGMNRYSAFQMLKLPSIVAQIIDYHEQETVELSSWLHLFSITIEKFIDLILKTGKIEVKKATMENVGHRYIKEEGKGRICTVIHKDGSVYLLYTNGNLIQKIKTLNTIVSFYHEHIIRDVLPVKPSRIDIKLLFEEHKGVNTMVIFPTFTRHQIVDVVKQEGLFPPGVTRHIIQRRCLNINVPLSLFDSKYTIVKQNEELEEILVKRSFRLYEEPTIYFE